MPKEVVFDVNEIKDIIPHRYPFLMIDSIIQFDDGQEIMAVKCITANEPFFQGHFPEKPVMPGVLILEALAQTAAVLGKRSTGGVPADKLLYLVGAKDVKWKRQVVPGDTLVLKVTLVKRKRPLLIVAGEATVEGELVASATITAAEGA